MTKTKQKYNLFTAKGLAFLIIPIVIESALSMSLGVIDGLMVTNSTTNEILASDPLAADHYVTAITDIDQISNLLIQLFSAFGVGGAVITSQYIGAERLNDANKSAKQLIMLMLLVAVAVMGLCLALNRQIIGLFFGSLDDHTFRYASTYFYITACSYPFLAVFNSCAALLRAQRKSMNTMLSGVISFFLNIAFNALFIFAFKLGIAGVALGTLLARIFPACFTLFLMTRKTNAVRIRIFERFRFDGSQLKKIAKLGVPSGIENSFFQLGKILVLVFIQIGIYNTFLGVDEAGNALYVNYQSSANSVAYNVNTMSSIVGNGINTSIITVIGQAVGTGNLDQVKYYIKKMMLISYVGNAACVGLIWAMSPLILTWYNVSGEAREIAQSCLHLCLSVQFVTYPLSFGLPAVLKANSDVKYVMISSVVSMVLMRVGLCYLLTCEWAGFRMGAMGLWIGMVSDWAVRSVLFGARLASGKWKFSSGLLNGAQSAGDSAQDMRVEEGGSPPPAEAADEAAPCDPETECRETEEANRENAAR